MKKLILDTNIIDKCYELNITKSFFNDLGFEIWIPTFVKNEVENSKKTELIKTLEDLDYTKTGFFGFSDNPNSLGFGDKTQETKEKPIFYSKEYDEFIKSTSKKHQNDRYIATLSNLNNAIFITNDKKAYADVSNNINSLYFQIDWTREEFKKALLQQMFV
ncbi:PIN domain-containing protein [Arcobacter porcinus]|uniref:PIN domain-containing protein n=1 Tax=Arcobacter porcinus TaxID=1935204 RepID=A0A5C2HFU9_9BACT|nr:PIN domain-containing protein [Arcobacter porcinus]OCL94301.1 hypothetical protein AAX27_01098 [Aliarcobacter thereius]QEP41004.1 hypothetical protein APORC_1420 [Arcobacter porcinus]